MRRLIAIGVILVAGVVALALSGAYGAPTGLKKTYKIVFDNAFGLTEGGDLKIAGVKAGITPKLEVTASYPHRAVVTAKIQSKGFAALREDASCAVRQQALIGEYYVDCQTGRSKKVLPDGATIPVEQTTSTVPADLLGNIQRRPYRERFRLILAELGTGLAGRPQDLATTLRRAHPGLRETSKTLKILGEQNRIIKNFINDSDTVMVELERRKKDVARWVKETGETSEIAASRDAAQRATLRRLPTFFRELEPTMVELGHFADEQTPLLRGFRRIGGESGSPPPGSDGTLDRFFEELGPFSEASRPSFRSLGELGDTARPILRKSQDEIRQLRRVAADAPPLAKHLRQLLQTLDDRFRARDDDPRAKNTAPPAPDKTRYREGTGFTGFEALANYFFWQTLTINAFDDVSHFLRVLVIESHNCSPYATDPGEELQHECGSYLGPYQPGLDGNAPDPTEDRDGIRFTRRPADRRGAGDPEADPLPGQPDPSKPGIVMPEAVRDLLRERGASPSGGRPPRPADEQLLDYLLAP
jgi:ABC-type transporter Mla subunit MlaD